MVPLPQALKVLVAVNEDAPGPDITTDEALEEHIRKTLVAIFREHEFFIERFSIDIYSRYHELVEYAT